jgi:catechol 2,3-dioxygenase-like lactoylglutathione lyase family enzyme
MDDRQSSTTGTRPLDTSKMELAPPRLSEIVLKTSRYDEMKAWYQTVLGVQAYFEHTPRDWTEQRRNLTDRLPLDLKLCFIRVAHQFPYSQVLALFDYPDLATADPKSSGLHHMQFRNASLPDLLVRYQRLKEQGITPYKCFNHGPAMSFYYDDVDGNLVELSASNYPLEADYMAYFKSAAFAANPVGVPVDADRLLARLLAGEAPDSLGRIS